jgi:molybdopterin-guanine dinucleotide biosynthesis protein A
MDAIEEPTAPAPAPAKPPPIPLDQITGLVLAGGRGTRMGSIDKGLQTFQGKPMAQHSIERLRPQVGCLFINANQNVEIYEGYGIPVLPDVTPDYAGPLAGIEAGMLACTTPYIITAPCDSPLFPEDLVARLSYALLRGDNDVAFPITGYGPLRESHPVFAMLKTSLLPDLSLYLKKGGHKMLTWFASKNMVQVFFEDDYAFRNINTLDELRRLEG